MKIEEFETIMEDESIDTVFPQEDNALVGLNMITKYLPKKGVEAAEHDIIYSVYVEEIVNAGITVEDAKKLKKLNWMILDDSLACYV